MIPTRIGKYRDRITIQQVAETRDETGGIVSTWQTYATVWAGVEPLRGQEMWAANEQQVRVSTRIRIRYLKGVTAKMRVLFGSRIYKIVSVIDPEERHREMQLMADEWVAV